jgi:hypothetical protein
MKDSETFMDLAARESTLFADTYTLLMNIIYSGASIEATQDRHSLFMANLDTWTAKFSPEERLDFLRLVFARIRKEFHVLVNKSAWVCTTSEENSRFLRDALPEVTKECSLQWWEATNAKPIRNKDLADAIIPASIEIQQRLKEVDSRIAGEIAATQPIASVSVATNSQVSMVTDAAGKEIGVAIRERFIWTCSKADIGRICKYMRDNGLTNLSGTDLARKAVQFLPDCARDATDEKATKNILYAINNAEKVDRQTTRLDLQSSAEAVSQYWK